MLSVFNAKKSAFGLDISDLSIKIVNLKSRGRNLEVASYGRKDVPRGVIEKGRIQDEGKLVKILKESFGEVKGEKISTRYAVCSLPEEEAFLSVIQLPPVSEGEVEKALRYELESQIPLKIDEIYYDFQVIHPPQNHEKHTNVLVAAIPKQIVDSYVSVLKKAGIQPIGLEIESQAAATSLIKDFQSPHPVVILDIGATGTGLTIFSGNTILLTSHVLISGQDFTNAVVKNLNVSFKEAETLKKKIGLDRTKEKERVYEALVPLLTDFSEQVQKFMNFFRDHGKVEYAPDGVISKVLLCGGDSLLDGLPKFLSDTLGLQVELGNPLINIANAPGKNPSSMSPKESLGYAVALGLALRGAANTYANH